MKRLDALFVAPLLAFAPLHPSRADAQVLVQEMPADICTADGTAVEDGESENGRNILSSLETLVVTMDQTEDKAKRDVLSTTFLMAALSCASSDVDAAQVTLERRPFGPEDGYDKKDMRGLLDGLKEILVAQEAAPQSFDEIFPEFEEEVPYFTPSPLLTNA